MTSVRASCLASGAQSEEIELSLAEDRSVQALSYHLHGHLCK